MVGRRDLWGIRDWGIRGLGRSEEMNGILSSDI